MARMLSAWQGISIAEIAPHGGRALAETPKVQFPCLMAREGVCIDWCIKRLHLELEYGNVSPISDNQLYQNPNKNNIHLFY